jgi:hypothetical protein
VTACERHERLVRRREVTVALRLQLVESFQNPLADLDDVLAEQLFARCAPVTLTSP